MVAQVMLMCQGDILVLEEEVMVLLRLDQVLTGLDRDMRHQSMLLLHMRRQRKDPHHNSDHHHKQDWMQRQKEPGCQMFHQTIKTLATSLNTKDCLRNTCHLRSRRPVTVRSLLLCTLHLRTHHILSTEDITMTLRHLVRLADS